jgi:hypothetical protein
MEVSFFSVKFDKFCKENGIERIIQIHIPLNGMEL